MTDELALPEAPVQPPSLPFYEVWNIALRRPTLEAYQRLLEDPKASLGRAVTWLLVVGAVSGLLSGVSQLVWMQLMGSSAFSQLAGPGQMLPQQAMPQGLGMAALVICAIPLSAIGVVIGSMIYYGLVHFTASAFGGQGTFGQMMYINAAYYAPIALISSLLSLIPCAACLAVPLGIYSFALQFLAVRAATKLGWGGAIGSILIVFFLFLMISLVLALLVFLPMMDQIQATYPTL
jgi:hypothetical protein